MVTCMKHTKNYNDDLKYYNINSMIIWRFLFIQRR